MNRGSFGAAASLLLALCQGGCAQSKGYVVAVYASKEPGATGTVDAQVQDLRTAVEGAGGRVTVARVDVEHELPNPAAGDLSSMPLGRMVVAEFESRRAARQFSRGSRARALDDGAEARAVTTVARFAAKPFKPLPSMPDAPPLCDERPDGPPAFVLLDGITMKKGPAAPFRVMRYMKRNLPRLEHANVQLLTTLRVERVDAGAFDFDMLFLSQWPNSEAFEAFHDDPEFIGDARRLRNPSFRRFGEAKGIVKACEATDVP